jgi:HD-like signal output (HDOD) protein
MGKANLKYGEIFHGDQLPVIPPGATYLLKALSDDSIEIPELAQIIERVPTIAARLIALANSAWSSPVSTISSLENACARLGFSVVRSTSIALAVSAPFDVTRCPPFDAKMFWSSSLLAADATAWLTPLPSTQPKMSVSTNRTAGLLHNLGLLLMADQMPDMVRQSIEMANEASAPSLRVALQSVIGIDYTDAGAYLGETWQLPAPLSIAMQYHASLDYQGEQWEVASLVGLAASMVSAVQRKTPWPMPEATLARLGIELTAANKVFERLCSQAEKTRKLAEALFY